MPEYYCSSNLPFIKLPLHACNVRYSKYFFGSGCIMFGGCYLRCGEEIVSTAEEGDGSHDACDIVCRGMFVAVVGLVVG